jgi:hypothetical protein
MPQPTRFWRFSYDSDESLAEMLENGSLIAPSVGPRSEKYDPAACIATRIRVGDGIFLGKLDADLGVGCIVAIGIVQNAKPVTSVSWKQTRRSVHPNPQGGLAAWRERCFLFNGGPADRYNLAGEFLHHFPNG